MPTPINDLNKRYNMPTPINDTYLTQDQMREIVLEKAQELEKANKLIRQPTHWTTHFHKSPRPARSDPDAVR